MGRSIEKKLVPMLQAATETMEKLNEQQKILLENHVTLMTEMKNTREDISKLRHAVLYVFEIITRSGGDGRSSSRIDELVRNGIDALASRRGSEALQYLNKIKSEK